MKPAAKVLTAAALVADGYPRAHAETMAATGFVPLPQRPPSRRGRQSRRPARDEAGQHAVSQASAAEIRSWARSAGVDCPAMGIVPQRVRDAYGAAH